MDERPSKELLREAERLVRLAELASAAQKKVVADIRKRKRLIANLNEDLVKHGDPEMWKRFGDLLLANLHTAVRDGDVATVSDYFDETVPQVEIEAGHNLTLSDVAERYFRRYAKARDGREVIFRRLSETETAIAQAEQRLIAIASAEAAGDEEFLTAVTAKKRIATEARQPKKKDAEIKGVRQFVSSDGFQIFVGKAAKDNAYLTFRIAASLDTWFHAADYPGSHVVIRNPNKKEIPQRTMIEAANLAAFYSGARELDKAAVNYTQRKFVNKIKGGPVGMVRLASFKTLFVEPKVPFDKE